MMFMMLRKLEFIAEMRPGVEGLPCTRPVLPSSILPISCWLSPSPPAFPRGLGGGERRHSLPGSPGGQGGRSGLGRRLQLRAAASRWNFLTNTRSGGPQLPGRWEARGSFSPSPRAGVGFLGSNSWGVPLDRARRVRRASIG